MDVDLALNLPSDTSAPGLARAAARRHLSGKICPERLAELSLVISELVSNAIEHGRGQVIFRLRFDKGTVSGEVIDQGGGFEHEIRAQGPEDLRGRGLFLVAELADRWGVRDGTTHVWFELGARTGASSRPAIASPR
jgi:anti-sigma regulatory factor (Ser/Thr protein kinase)